MYVVGERFDARGLRFVIFPLGGAGFRATRFETVSDSDPPELETLWACCVVSGLIALRTSENAAALGDPSVAKEGPEIDFWRALVSASVSRAKASEIQEFSNAGRNAHVSMLVKSDEEAMFVKNLTTN